MDTSWLLRTSHGQLASFSKTYLTPLDTSATPQVNLVVSWNTSRKPFCPIMKLFTTSLTTHKHLWDTSWTPHGHLRDTPWLLSNLKGDLHPVLRHIVTPLDTSATPQRHVLVFYNTSRTPSFSIITLFNPSKAPHKHLEEKFRNFMDTS
jgi:hypothetical protein